LSWRSASETVYSSSNSGEKTERIASLERYGVSVVACADALN